MLLSENIMNILTDPTAGCPHKVTADEADRETRASKRNASVLAFAKARPLPGRILNLSTKGTKRTIMGRSPTKPQDFDEMWY
jgi:hypothetical protein